MTRSLGMRTVFQQGKFSICNCSFKSMDRICYCLSVIDICLLYGIIFGEVIVIPHLGCDIVIIDCMATQQLAGYIKIMTFT